jgi:hypothetical protein
LKGCQEEDNAVTVTIYVPGAIPSYLISVIPEIKVDGEVVKSGTAMSLGEEL